MHVLVLMITGRFSHRVYVSYTTVSHVTQPVSHVTQPVSLSDYIK